MFDHEKSTCAQLPRAEAIARLNDKLRVHGMCGQILVTRSVMDLPAFNPVELTHVLARYEGFDAVNDPHGERDFGDLQLFGADLLWKIDYYDIDLVYGSPDPADAMVTTRVLTVMLAGDW